MARHAIISGGSISGLFVAVALRQAGWHVDVYERSDVELAGRGAGIVTHKALVDALVAVGADISDLGVHVDARVAFDKRGDVVRTLPFPQVVTSWDRIHSILRRMIPDAHHHLDHQVADFEQRSDGVEVFFTNGASGVADLLIGADGFRSAVRGIMLPDVAPIYSGYVVWRSLTHEIDIPEDIRRSVFPTFGFYVPTGTQIIGYPIAGPGNDLRPNHRRYNFVWYAAVEPERLADMLTDATGHQHDISIPPPLIRNDILEQIKREAHDILPRPFVTILENGERPFFTPIYDHLVRQMTQDNVALVGDAACVARPHVGMGVTKAVCDGLSLAKHLTHTDDIKGALGRYSQERLPASAAAHYRARALGEYIFDATIDNPDGRSNPRLDEIMRTTAVTVD